MFGSRKWTTGNAGSCFVLITTLPEGLPAWSARKRTYANSSSSVTTPSPSRSTARERSPSASHVTTRPSSPCASEIRTSAPDVAHTRSSARYCVGTSSGVINELAIEDHHDRNAGRCDDVDDRVNRQGRRCVWLVGVIREGEPVVDAANDVSTEQQQCALGFALQCAQYVTGRRADQLREIDDCVGRIRQRRPKSADIARAPTGRDDDRSADHVAGRVVHRRHFIVNCARAQRQLTADVSATFRSSVHPGFTPEQDTAVKVNNLSEHSAAAASAHRSRSDVRFKTACRSSCSRLASTRCMALGRLRGVTPSSAAARPTLTSVKQVVVSRCAM